MEYAEEIVRFPASDGLVLDGRLAYPWAAPPVAGLVVFAPHPVLGGDMDNNVVAALWRDLVADVPLLRLRFDYRGVGASASPRPGVPLFEIWDLPPGPGIDAGWPDAESALTFLRGTLARVAPGAPIVLAGFSYGAILALASMARGCARGPAILVSPPVGAFTWEGLAARTPELLLIGAREDFAVGEAELRAFGVRAGPNARVEVLEASDHFWRGEESRITALASAWLRPRLPAPQPQER